MKKLTAIVIGYGLRGESYSRYSVVHPEKLEIVGVAEPDEKRKKRAMENLNLSEDKLYNNWEEIAKLPKMADIAMITTQDRMHLEPAIAMIEKGYDILLEKPMSYSKDECKQIADAANKKGVKVVVCHVLRFAPLWRKIKDIIDDGEIGTIMNITHQECVGFTHYAHSFTRGDWNNSDTSSPMILAKSCHDTDMMQWLIGKKCTKVHSFGKLTYFKPENKPKDAADYCVDCKIKGNCAYNAEKYYLETNVGGWKRKIGNTDEEIQENIKTSPYGRCVFSCDNNVVDHQVVNMEFEGDATVSFTMSAFTKGGRFIKIMGTEGQLEASAEGISVYKFKDKEDIKYDIELINEGIEAGHGGGDFGIMNDFLMYVGENIKTKSISTIDTSYENHLIAFAAEESRLTDKVIIMDEYK